MRRLMRAVPGLAEKSLRSLTPQDCRESLQIAYPTPSQQRKARAILSGVFSVGRRRGWCSENPLQLVDAPAVQEKEIVPQPLHEVRQLVETEPDEPLYQPPRHFPPLRHGVLETQNDGGGVNGEK